LTSGKEKGRGRTQKVKKGGRRFAHENITEIERGMSQKTPYPLKIKANTVSTVTVSPGTSSGHEQSC